MRVKLPNGIIDGSDHFNYAIIDELRGKQQNYLVNRELVIGNLGHIPKILEDLIVSLETQEGIQWKGSKSELVNNKLPSGDIETLLIKIRENTYGPRFYHEAICPHCEKQIKNLRLDLDTLELKEMSVEEMLQKKLIILPKSKLEVELKPTYLKDLFKIVKIGKSKQDKLITSLLAIAVKRIGTDTNITDDILENIPVVDLVHLQEEITKIKLEGTIDTDIEVTCDNSECGKEFSIKLNCLDPDFFSPTKGSMNTDI